MGSREMPQEQTAHIEATRRRAYEIWQQEGRPDGRAEEHWRMAEAETVPRAGGKAGPDGAARAKASRPGKARAASIATAKPPGRASTAE